MRKTGLLLLLIPSIVCAQISVDFENGTCDGMKFSVDDHWTVEHDNAISGEWSLHHSFDNSEAGNDVFALSLTGLKPELDTVEWCFRVKHAYNPSSSNNWAIYLMTDKDASGIASGDNISGFMVGVNQGCYDDSLRLWKIEQGSRSVVVTASVNWQNDIGTDQAAYLKITRSPAGEWLVFIQDPNSDFVPVGSGFDPAMTFPAWLAFIYNYTSSCDRLIWVDDIAVSGMFVSDSTAPHISSAYFTEDMKLRVNFSEPVNAVSFVTGNYFLVPGNICPSFIEESPDGSSISLVFKDLPNKSSFDLIVNQLCDLSGNCSSDTLCSLNYAYPCPGDIIISEIMTDPDPPVNLPTVEYIELLNRSDWSFNTGGIKMLYGNKSYDLPYTVIGPGEYLLLVDTDHTCLFDDIKIAGVNNFPALHNDNGYVVISGKKAGTLHGVEYSGRWFHNSLKNDGGWSFEIIDSDYPFSMPGNWAFSENENGGTPGRPNSVGAVNPDLDSPLCKYLFPPDDSSLLVSFNEPVRGFDNTEIYPSGDNTKVSYVVPVDSLRRVYRIVFRGKIIKGINYTIYLPGISDYAGNPIGRMQYGFGLPQKPGWNDVIINELLFDPLPGDPEYFEVYNNSEKCFDLSSFKLGIVKDSARDTALLSSLSDYPACFMPGEYLAVSENHIALLDRYFTSDPDYVKEVSGIPSFPDDNGEIILYYRDLSVVDHFYYSEDLHSDFLSSCAGVSIERIDNEGETNMISNWHSASGLCGWGTPGVRNSVYMSDDTICSPSLSLSSRRITPNNDGFEDILRINISPGKGEWLLELQVYNDMGYPVRSLASGLVLLNSATLYWDGSDESSMICSEGIYIIYAKAVSNEGDVKRWKKVCALYF